MIAPAIDPQLLGGAGVLGVAHDVGALPALAVARVLLTGR
jgi:hypothetical protein